MPGAYDEESPPRNSQSPCLWLLNYLFFVKDGGVPSLLT